MTHPPLKNKDTLFKKNSLILAMSLTGLVSLHQTHAAQIEEIQVTGQGIGSLRLNAENGAGSRLGLTAFETPASVDLITSQEILAKGDYDALAAITRSAGMTSSGSPGNGGTSVSARGFNGHGTTVNTYDGTRLYITAGTVTFPADTWTLDRVEVLRGAGAVINGVGALASTVNYIPKSADFDGANFEALVAAGSFGMHRVALGGGNQINDEWAFRLDGSYQDSDGFADRAGETRKVLAGSLLFKPSEDFSMRFSLDYADIDASPYWGTPLINGEASTSLRRNNYNFEDAFVNYEDIWARVRTDWRLSPNVTFRNDTYYIKADREWQNLELYSFSAASQMINRADYLGIRHDQSQVGTRGDFLIEGDFGGLRNRFTIGAEVNTIKMDYHNNFSTGGFDVMDSVPVFGFNPGRMPMATAPTILDYSTSSRQYAVFFDDVLEVTERLSLVLGGRYDDFDFDRNNHALVTGRGASSFDAAFSRFTWRAGVVYEISDNFNVYAQTSTAADPVTSPISINAANADFNLSTGRQYEVGLKQQFLEGRAEYTLAYFDIVKKGMVTRQPGATVSEQIGQASSNGVEFTLRINPTDTLNIDFNAAVLDAQYDEFFSGTTSLRGNTPNNVPEKTANLWVNWVPAPQFSIGTGMRYVDKRFGNDLNTLVLPSYTVFDAAATWFVNSQTSVILRARNFTNEKDFVLAQYGANQWIFGDPRSYELSFRYSL